MPHYKSNMQKVVTELIKQTKQAANLDKTVREIATTVRGNNIARIHNRGEAINGRIGQYSTKPMLTSRSAFVTKSGYNAIAGSKTKRRKLDWVTIKGHKLFELPGGYKQFRNLQGRRTDTVDLSLTGRLQNSLVISGSRSRWVIGFISRYGADISEAQEDRFKKRIWGMAKEDFAIARGLAVEHVRKSYA